MIKKLLLVSAMGLFVSGCYMVPLAFIGPATSGFTTTSVVQSAISATANHMVKKTTGKSFSEHAFEAINKDILQQTYLPKKVDTAIKVTP